MSSVGNDAWTGESADPIAGAKSGPKKTLQAALKLARSLHRASPAPTIPVEIILRGGTYELADTLVLTPDDSGTAASPLIIKAQAGEEPVLSGGTSLEPIKRSDSLWTAATPKTFHENPFSQLYIDGERRQRVRMPKQGYYQVAGSVHPSDPAARDAFRFYPGDIGTLSKPDEVLVRAFYKWSVYTLQVAQFDGVGRILSFNFPAPGRPRIPFDGTVWYLLENVAGAPLAAGEWYFDRAADELRYAPKTGEVAATTRLVVPRLETLLRLKGEKGSGRKIEFIKFAGITFAETDWKLPATGLRSVFGAILTAGSVEVSDARDITFTACTFRETGAYGLVLGADVQRGSVTDSVFKGLGAGGIRIGSGIPADQKNPAQWTSECTVRNSLITAYGQVHPDGVGIFVGYAGHTSIEHNDVTGGYYTGISIGWVLNYGVFAARDNIVRQNHVWKIGQRVLSDMGGIYTMGEQPGTQIIGNVVSDIREARYGGWGIYCDEGSASISVRNNLAYDFSSAALHLHWGRDIDIASNIFALGRNYIFENTNPERTGMYRLHDNILLTQTGPFFGNLGINSDVQIDGNLYLSTSGTKKLFPGGMDLTAWRKREPTASIEDPGFRNPAAGDFTALHPELLATRGIDPALFATAGRLSGPKVPVESRVFWEPAPEPRGTPFSVNFDENGADDLAGFVKSVASPAQSIELSSERAHSAPNALKFNDGPLGAVWQPLASREAHIKDGNVRVGLWLWAGKGSVPWITMRDTREITVNGPSVSVSGDGNLTAGGRSVMKCPFETWCRIELTFGIGTARTGTWDLSVTTATGGAKSFPGLPLPKDFLGFDWFGVAGYGTTPASFFVDDISVAVSEQP